MLKNTQIQPDSRNELFQECVPKYILIRLMLVSGALYEFLENNPKIPKIRKSEAPIQLYKGLSVFRKRLRLH